MGFYENFEKLCHERGITQVCSKEAEEKLGIKKGTISAWKRDRAKTPSSKYLKLLTERLNTTMDYLLGETNDPTDYSDGDLIADHAGAALDHFNGDTEKAVSFHKAVDNDARSEMPLVLKLYNKLTYEDQQEVISFIKFKLSMYEPQEKRNTASHAV